MAGTLLNSAVADIMTSICSLEDISADDATQLSALLSLLTARALGLYQMDGEGDTPSFLLHKHVTKWGKLGELQIILNAGLHDISDRWADGKGPIAAVFSPDELKQLIRALFQNTDRRAAVLAKI